MADVDIIARLKLNGENFSSEMDKRFGALERRAESVSSRLNVSFAKIGVAGAGLAVIGAAAAAAAAQALEFAEAYKAVNAQLKLATDASGSFTQAQADAARIATDTRSGLTETSALYSNFIRASRDLGKSQDDAGRATETFSKALKIGGADAASAASATLQFGQALASGVLRGDEFNSIAEASPRILKLIADSLGVTQGALRGMAAEGKLSADVLYKALTDRKFTAGIDAEFGELPNTFDQSMTQIRNAAIVTFGEFDKGGQFSAALAGFVSDGADGFVTLSTSAREFGVELRSDLSGLGSAFDPMIDAGRAAFEALGIQGRSFSNALHDSIYNNLKDIDNLANTIRHLKPYLFSDRGPTLGSVLGIPDANAAGRFEDGYQRTQRQRRGELAAQDLEDRFGKYDPSKPYSLSNRLSGSDPLGVRQARQATKAEQDAAKKAAAEAKREAEKAAALWEKIEISARNVGYEVDRIKYDPTDYGDVRPDTSEFNRRQEEAVQAAADAMDELNRKQEESFRTLSDFFYSAFDRGSGNIWKSFKREGESVIADIAAQYALAMLSGQSVNLGQAANNAIGRSSLGSLLSAAGGANKLLGLGSIASQSGTLSTLAHGGSLFGSASVVAGAGGALPSGAGGALSLSLGSGAATGGLASTLSAAAPYLALASVALPLVSGLFKKTKKASASIVTGGDDFGVTVTGNSASRKSSASAGAGSVEDSLRQIAEQLGGSINDLGRVSIGVRKNSYRVDTSGAGRTKNGVGVLDFGSDQQAAIEAAVRDLIADGALTGISAASQRILKSGKDLQTAITQAAGIEAIPKLLKARLDPLGAAIDEVNDKWAAQVKVLRDAGASVEQMADAQKLYRLELADAEKTTNAAREALVGYASSLSAGGNSPLSLRDQEVAAKAALQPFLDTIGKGAAVDSEKYQAAASAFLDVERELYGSTDKYFQAFGAIQDATNKAIASIDAVTPIRGATVDPFAEKTATATQATAEISAQTNDLLVRAIGLLGQVAANTGSSTSAGFIGAARNFVNAA